MKIVLDYIGGNKNAKMLNEMMHYCDIFEGGKHFGLYKQIEITGNPDLNKLIDNIKDSLELSGENIVFLSIRTIDGFRVNKYKPFFIEKIQTISTLQNGKFGWILFSDMLKTLGYKVMTDESMNVINVN